MDEPMSKAVAPKKVNNACARCRRQKLKCDVQRPCLLCTRAGVECTANQVRAWTEYNVTDKPSRKRRGVGIDCRQKKKGRATSTAEQDEDDVHQSDGPAITNAPSADCNPATTPNDAWAPGTADKDSWGKSSSTVMLVEEAFHQHDSASPEMAETSALGYSQAATGLRYYTCSTQKGRRSLTSIYTRSGHPKVSRSAILELAQLLPNRGIMLLLVNNYFDKIHWFMLLFHQREFKESIEALYPNTSPISPATGRQDGLTVGYISVLLAVCALSLRYTSSAQQEQLAKQGVDADTLRERILNILRLRLLDILSLGSLEAVQLCVLLGSYYLYHGEPELAWPLCGCALRLAQALELHQSPVTGADLMSQKVIGDRKRCWWAVHEIETFCSMVYGFPLSISDADCDVEPLDPSDPWSIAADGQLPSTDQPTLLAYKCSMSTLTKIVKAALEDLYRSRQKNSRFGIGSAERSETTTRLQLIVKRINSLDEELRQWYASLPSKLKIERHSGPPTSRNEDARHSPPGPASFEEKLFQLQALSLKLAFENARILIHRPLLFHQTNDVPEVPCSSTTPKASGLDPLQKYSRTCHDAALQISWTGRVPIFKEASATYALNFVSLHLLTAGVTLGIMTSEDPLSKKSFEAKLGIRRIMEMQAALKDDSIVADQGFGILRKLLSLVMKKETQSMLDFGARGREKNQARTATEHRYADSESMGAESDGRQQQSSDGNLPFTLNPDPFRRAEVSQHITMPDTMLDVEQGDLLHADETAAFTYPSFLGLADGGATFDNAGNTGPVMIGQDPGWLWDPELGIGSFGWSI
ncbi:hypothetical protein F4678DRAFT_441622 [Xylaria arbuscula]|nr:hypothetical protein F4678DRAFT_441622 [Xylaria arbuscula]